MDSGFGQKLLNSWAKSRCENTWENSYKKEGFIKSSLNDFKDYGSRSGEEDKIIQEIIHLWASEGLELDKMTFLSLSKEFSCSERTSPENATQIRSLMSKQHTNRGDPQKMLQQKWI